ncbi:hypothetical protein Z517_05759 [Fonsecaea pedrosoi CBS 271.37]|uniref:Unplaced genomic scaffold supercont1.3, whole genome shotgun sequence n=1 Tax=Fonsecaea pedrosoi CBS 271.37 TaxID=1442368 RepID=A0A0D2DY27_9EURO|nr:uncharacterized protein Z517_05759 [Fonsecaea pedrosoi CBS 271.37]KIW82731.1 hypothetical protein Z517_05759 [Fonsecaea pedrosoi CBS 271.37]
MPRGELNVRAASSVPAQNPLYPTKRIEYSDTDMLRIEYLTSAEAVKHLIPDDFEIEDKPLVGVTAANWGFSQFGAYSELITTVEVTYQGIKYDFGLELILENEAALFMGREQLGCPKVIGRVVFDPTTTPRDPGFQLGHVERPVSHKVIQFGFRPESKIHGLQKMPVPADQKRFLVLRILPNLHNDKDPVVREYVAIQNICTEGELWTGTGSINYAPTSRFLLTTQLPVLEYRESILLRHSAQYISTDFQTFELPPKAGTTQTNGKVSGK